MLNIYFQELKAHRKNIILWSIGMIMLIVMGMAKMSAYQSSGDNINKLFAELPRVFKAITGATGFDLATAKGFFALLFLYIVIMVAIHAVLLGSEIIAKEERDKTAEFLLTKPLTRSAILSSKILAGLTLLSVLTVVTLLASVIIVGAYNDGASITSDITKLMFGMFLIQLIFYSVGVSLAAISKNPRSSSQIGAMIVLVTYLAYVLVGIFDTLNFLKYVSPFRFFEADAILNNGYSPIFILMTLVIILVCLGFSYKKYPTRDQTLT